MKSGQRGDNTSGVELQNVSAHGIWILVDGREHYLGFEDFPWFRNATIADLADIERPRARHVRWPRLDVDLTLEAIEEPGRYPLVSRG